MADNKPHPRLSIEQMRHRFNKGKYWQRLKDGELEEHIVEYHPDTAYPEVIQRHPGAVSVTTRYRDRSTGQDLVEVHYFRLPDGSVIPGKRPDPKLLFEDGVWYHQEKKKQREKRLAEEAKRPIWIRAWKRFRAMIGLYETRACNAISGMLRKLRRLCTIGFNYEQAAFGVA
jgi:hypothetical protein